MFKCENGHASLEGGFCDECGSQMFKQDSDVAVAVTSSTEYLDVNLGEISRTVGTSDVSSVALTVDSGKQILDTHGNGSSTYAELQALTDVVHQQNRNEDTLRQLCENIMADNFVTRDEWLELQSLKHTVTEKTWAKYMLMYNITEPKAFSAPAQIGTLYWRVDGVLQAKCSCVLEFRVSDLVENLALLHMTFSGPSNEFHWTTTFTDDSHDLQETSWTPMTHGKSMITITGKTETQDEILTIGTQRSIRLQVDQYESSSTTVINATSFVAGEVGNQKSFGVPTVPGFLANKGKQPAQVPESEWNGLPLVIKKREPKVAETPLPTPPPEPTLDEQTVLSIETVLDNPPSIDEPFAMQIVPAKGLAPRPYTIYGPNNDEVIVYFGERLVLGRISESSTIDPKEQLGIACYLQDGEDDIESTNAISRKTLVFEQGANAFSALNVGRSMLLVDDTPVSSNQELTFTTGQQATITMGANPRLQPGLKPAVLYCQIIQGQELTVDIQDAFVSYDETYLVLNKQPGALILSQKAGRDVYRTVWITGAVTLEALTGTRKRGYEDIVIFRHGSRLWIQDRSRQSHRVLELSHQSLAELVSGFQVTQD